MYKRRIQLWHLDKKNKEHEVRAALQLAAQRQKDGLSPVSGVQIRQRNVAWAEIDRYLRRKRVKDPQKWAAEGCHANQTPNPEPDETGQELVPDELTLCPATTDGQTPFTSAIFGFDLLSSPSPRQEDFLLEKLHMAVHAYCDSKYHAHRSNEGQNSHDELRFHRRRFSRLLESGVVDLGRLRPRRAFYRIDRAFGHIRFILERNNPRLLLTLFGQVMILLVAGLRDLVFHLLRHLVSMSSIIIGNQHPIYAVADSLIRYPPNLLFLAADSGLRNTITIILCKSGPSISWTLDSSDQSVAFNMPLCMPPSNSIQICLPEQERAAMERRGPRPHRQDQSLGSNAWLHDCCDLDDIEARHSYEHWTRSTASRDFQDALCWDVRETQLVNPLENLHFSKFCALNRGSHVLRTCEELRSAAQVDTTPHPLRACPL